VKRLGLIYEIRVAFFCVRARYGWRTTLHKGTQKLGNACKYGLSDDAQKTGFLHKPCSTLHKSCTNNKYCTKNISFTQ
jgi:hypothetical protein